MWVWNSRRKSGMKLYIESCLHLDAKRFPGIEGQRRGQVQGLLPGALQSEQAKIRQHRELRRRSQWQKRRTKESDVPELREETPGGRVINYTKHYWQDKDWDLTTGFGNTELTELTSPEVTGEPDTCSFCGLMEAKHWLDWVWMKMRKEKLQGVSTGDFQEAEKWGSS